MTLFLHKEQSTFKIGLHNFKEKQEAMMFLEYKHYRESQVKKSSLIAAKFREKQTTRMCLQGKKLHSKMITIVHEESKRKCSKMLHTGKKTIQLPLNPRFDLQLTAVTFYHTLFFLNFLLFYYITLLSHMPNTTLESGLLT